MQRRIIFEFVILLSEVCYCFLLVYSDFIQWVTEMEFLCVGSEVLNCFMYFAGLSTNFCHSMVAISAFVEKLWSTYTRFCWWWRQGVSRIINQMLSFCLVESGPKEATNSINSSLLWDVFVLQKIEVCVTYYWIVGVFIDWIGCNRNRNQQKIVVENILSLLLFFRFWWNNG